MLVRHLRRRAAATAPRSEQAAVQVRRDRAARALVQVVDVLRDDGEVRDAPSASARCPAFGPTERTSWRAAVPGPHQRGVGRPRLRGRQRLGIEPFPEPGLRVPERGNAALADIPAPVDTTIRCALRTLAKIAKGTSPVMQSHFLGLAYPTVGW